MGANNHRSGGKIGGRHTTVIDAARPIIDFLLKDPGVSNIAIGHIKMGIKAGPQRVKIKEETGCLLIKIRGSASVQEIRVFAKELSEINKKLKVNFKNVVIEAKKVPETDARG
ncbi:MAG: DUF2103 domain-containing protein [Parcubacteria group bacterium]